MTPNKMREVISHIVSLEGGYSDDPSDSGGKTNHGITEKVARQSGYTGDMRDLSLQQAQDIYVTQYILGPKLDKVYDIDQQLGYDLIDFGINQGPVLSVKMLQRWLNAFNDGEKYYKDQSVDGVVGASTLGQLNAFIKQRSSQETLLLAIRCTQGVHYLEISEKSPKNERFLYGWIKNRV